MTNWGIRRVALALLALYIAAGAAVLLWPTRVDAPFDNKLATTLEALHAHGVPEFINYAFVESSANIVMFFPLGILLTLVWGSRLSWIAPTVGLAASSAAELAQMLLLPNRVASIEDVLANTIGTILGTVLVVMVRSSMTARPELHPVVTLHTSEYTAAAA
jgi:VanZ family protein